MMDFGKRRMPPTMIKKLTNVGDPDSAGALDIIMTEEVGRVAVGKR